MRSLDRRVALSALALAVPLVIAACGGSSGSSGASAAKSNVSAVATSPAVIHAEKVAKVEVVNPCKANLPLHWHRFITCAEAKLAITGKSDEAKAKRGALETCLFEAGNANHVLRVHNKAGRLHFEQVSAPDCIAQILEANSTASPSPSGSKS